MIDTIIHFILNKFVIIGFLVPIVLILKFIVHHRLRTTGARPEEFFFYSYASVATTHNLQRKKYKELQNTLFVVLVFLIILQLILSIPVLVN